MRHTLYSINYTLHPTRYTLYAIRFALCFLLFSICSCLFSCAPPVYEHRKLDMVWPLPPEEPKIKFVDYIGSSLDIGKKGTFAEDVFGEERVDSFIKPYGVAVDKMGRIYVTDIGKVWVIDLKNHDYYFIGTEPGIGHLRVSLGIAAASDGRVFVTDLSANRVYVYLNSKPIATLGLEGEYSSASGVALDEKRELIYVVDSNKHVVNVYSLRDYKKLRTMGNKGTEKGYFHFPTNIALDSQGNLYVVDTGNFRVQVFDPEGKFVRSFGQLGDTPGTFSRPKGIALDSEDNIYIVDAAFQNVQIWNKEGQFLMYLGDGGFDLGQFSLPAGLTIDDEDRIYVVEQVSKRVQIFQYMSKKWKQRQGEGAQPNPVEKK